MTSKDNTKSTNKKNIFLLNKIFLSVLVSLLIFLLSNNGFAQVITPKSSPLAQGEWRRLVVKQDGFFQITGGQMKTWGWDLSAVNPAELKLYGTHGGMLPEPNKLTPSYNLQEIAIQVSDGGDGIFNDNDFILFWGESPHKWKRNVNGYFYETNIYSDVTHYFLGLTPGAGKRIGTLSSSTMSPDININTYDYLYAYEKEEHKIYHSGRAYHGDMFAESSEKSFVFNAPTQAPGIPAQLRIAFAGKGVASSAQYRFNGPVIGGSNGLFGSDESTQLRYSENVSQFNINSFSGTNTLAIRYFKAANSSVGYLNYFEFMGKVQFILENQRIYQNSEVIGKNTARYTMNNIGKNYTLWDITDPWNPTNWNINTAGNTSTFVSQNNGKTQKLASNDGSDLFRVEDGGLVANQNLAMMSPPDLLIVAHPSFAEAAQKLAQHRRANDGLAVEVVTPQAIYNEFSCGTQDIGAIRNLAHYLYYQNTDKLKYILIFGDASYDYKDRVANNRNFVPTYESINSQTDVNSYCSDDYFGFLDSNDGAWINEQRLEVSVGRIPVGTQEEANQMVEKLVRYDNQLAFGKWRNSLTFLADDVDESWDVAHLLQTEQLTNGNEQNHANFNNRKIYMDAYKEVLLGGAGSFPEVNTAINEVLKRGTLVFNYIGHGGIESVAKERAIIIEQVKSWKNKYQMPVFITATCELASYDNPKDKPIGEYMILNPEGGPIAMLTTTRIVYSGPNFSLNQGVWINNILKNVENHRIGDVYKATKNRALIGDNDRRFTLFGDPSMRLAKPKNKVVLDSFNGAPLSNNDTLKALSLVKLSGHLEKFSGAPWNDFNGTVDITIYDKPLKETTLANGEQSQKINYLHERSIIYSGRVEAKNGRFECQFIVPKDINYSVETGKISFYAFNAKEDAAGYTTVVKIGGANPNPAKDDIGPSIKLYMNNKSFINGGFTQASPLFIADLTDEHGINVSSSGIGRGLFLTLDKGTENEKQFVVNDFYTSTSGTFKSGEINYPLFDLSEGEHTLTLRVWDTYNNSSEESISFIVGEATEEFEIYAIRSVPNPFSAQPRVILDHNRPNTNLEITNEVYNMNGQKIIDYTQTIFDAPAHIELELSNDENWVNAIAPGMYILRTNVLTSNGENKTFTQRILYRP